MVLYGLGEKQRRAGARGLPYVCSGVHTSGIGALVNGSMHMLYHLRHLWYEMYDQCLSKVYLGCSLPLRTRWHYDLSWLGTDGSGLMWAEVERPVSLVYHVQQFVDARFDGYPPAYSCPAVGCLWSQLPQPRSSPCSRGWAQRAGNGPVLRTKSEWSMEQGTI